MQDRYMAYVGSYSYNGKAKGITLYDVDVEKGTLTYRNEVEVENSSYLCVSASGKYLYSIADEGVVAFRILENGNLHRLNARKIKGMRGCHVTTDRNDEFLFVSGYHDGKETVLRLNEDGSIGGITDGIYHKGLGTVSERTFHPHISCAARTPEGRFVLVGDLGLDQVKIYHFDENQGTLNLVDAIRCELCSGPRQFMFTKDGRFLYLMYEDKNAIDVFRYTPGDRVPDFERIQTITTIDPKHPGELTAAARIRLSPDEKESHLFCSNAGDNSVSVYRRDPDTGLLTQLCCLPTAGDYPKDVAVFPDGKHIAVINHASASITTFRVDYEKGLLVMNSRELPINEPNCCVITKVI